ncbi:MAG: hypothetical protein WCP57_13005 [Bacteroidota bacterium]
MTGWADRPTERYPVVGVVTPWSDFTNHIQTLALVGSYDQQDFYSNYIDYYSFNLFSLVYYLRFSLRRLPFFSRQGVRSKKDKSSRSFGIIPPGILTYHRTLGCVICYMFYLRFTDLKENNYL